MNELTTAELILAIAKAKGIEPKPHKVRGIEDPDGGWYGFYCVNCYRTVHVDDEDKPVGLCCPNWPEDIAAAWELVEEMADDYVGIAKDDGIWYASYFVGNWPQVLKSDTAPCAICLAWLAWMEVKK